MTEKSAKRTKGKGEKYLLSGEMYLGRNGSLVSFPFEINFYARSFRRARRMGAGKLKGFVAGKLRGAISKKFIIQRGRLESVTGDKKKTALRPAAKNNGLMRLAPHEVFC